MSDETHSARHLASGVLYLAPTPPSRLVVFVHGFGGDAVATWEQFASPLQGSQWWQSADLFFFGYDSRRRTITGVAHELLRLIDDLYPRVRTELSEIDGEPARSPAGQEYGELYLVAHSLGGVVVRHAIADAVERSQAREARSASALLGATVRMFSPASAGFQAAGLLGLARATPGIWTAAEMYLRRSPAYSDLQPGSEYLTALRQRTEGLAATDSATDALRPLILWADPDDVVICPRYRTDPPDDSEPQTTHQTVCKPSPAYKTPWRFVEVGNRSRARTLPIVPGSVDLPSRRIG